MAAPAHKPACFLPTARGEVRPGRQRHSPNASMLANEIRYQPALSRFWMCSQFKRANSLRRSPAPMSRASTALRGPL